MPNIQIILNEKIVYYFLVEFRNGKTNWSVFELTKRAPRLLQGDVEVTTRGNQCNREEGHRCPIFAPQGKSVEIYPEGNM